MTKGILRFAVILLLILAVLYVAAFGLPFIGLKGVTDDDGINKGLDLVGGSRIIYKAEPDENATSDEVSEGMERVRLIMQERLAGFGYTEGTVSLLEDNMVQIEIPGINDPTEAVSLLGSTAKLNFVDADGNVIISGDGVLSAMATQNTSDLTMAGAYEVVFTLTSEAAATFTEAANKAYETMAEGKNYISIVMDEQTLSTPYVFERLTATDNSLSITGSFTKDEAENLAAVISSGQLPFELSREELDSVGPSLGEKSFSTSVLAGAIGIALIMIFMLAFYRLPGLVSVLALAGYIGIFGIVLTAARVNLSLPGIAGIILTIGMAVDANIIIFERIKEELRVGKTVSAALKAGFSRAFRSILDSNITTLISSVVLWYFGTGVIQGFAITLFIGVLISMFSALVVTRLLLKSFVDMGVKSTKLWGV